jgi:hypothetical protein
MTTESIQESAQRLAPSTSTDVRSRRVPTWAAVLVIAIVALIAMYGIAVAVHSTTVSVQQAHEAYGGATQNLQQASSITLSEFNAVQTGMSIQQVQTIMGSTGTQTVHQDLAGISGDIYSWQNSDGSNMNVQFQNGAVITKAQFGLQ